MTGWALRLNRAKILFSAFKALFLSSNFFKPINFPVVLSVAIGYQSLGDMCKKLFGFDGKCPTVQRVVCNFFKSQLLTGKILLINIKIHIFIRFTGLKGLEIPIKVVRFINEMAILLPVKG